MIKSLSFGIPLVLALALAGPARAQGVDLPRPSPFAKVSQMVGLTEVIVDYSSPAVRGRKIWGGLVPYGKVWRTGANMATKVTFSKDVTIEGKAVPAGSYSLFTIPAQGAWTLILNKNPTASEQAYKQELDLLRVPAKTKAIGPRERLTFLFADTTENATSLDLEWAGLRVAIPIKASTPAQVAANIKDLEDGAWRPFNAAARYLLESKKDYAHALKLVDQSLSLKQEWFNSWTKAQILAAMGQKAEACPYAQTANTLGQKAPFFFYAADVKKALAAWKCK
ncbi:MAG TPA: DUF2911 domain-containing protein [Polyangia bacterium]|jgi:hypothetical protein